jgi:hypothetical protein
MPAVTSNLAAGGTEMDTSVPYALPRAAAAATLHRGVKNLLRCDAGDVVSGIVSFVLTQRRSLRLAAAVLLRARETLVADAIMLLNGMRCFVGVHHSGAGGDAVTVARLSNEQRAIAALMRLAPDQRWSEFVFDWHPQAALAALPELARTAPTWRRIARISRFVSRRYDAFRAYRVVELLFYYERYVRLFANRRFRIAVMSSHSNPHGIALNLAARRFSVPVVLITHGMPITPIARLDYDLAIMECEASADVYRRAGCRLGRVIVKSRRDDHLPMVTRRAPAGALRVGIFLSKDPTKACFVSLVRSLLLDSNVQRILVRPHPVNLWPGLASCVTAMSDPRIRLSANSILDDVRECDFVLAGNSTVHVDAVVGGTPACYVRGLDHAPYDVQSFVRDGLVYELEEPDRFEPSAVEAFYARDQWPTVLRRYANVDQSDEALAPIVAAAINELAVGPGALT